jgi:hypothetical protein
MKIAEKIKNFLAKLQNLPDNKKKIILWTIVVIAGVVMGSFWIKGTIKNISKVGDTIQSIKMPEINIPDIPVPDLPNIENQSSPKLEPSK